MQTNQKAGNIDHCLNWIGKELKIYERYHDDEDDGGGSSKDDGMEWLLNYSDTHVAVAKDCKLVGIGHYRHCYLCIYDNNDNEFELIQVNSPCKYEGEKITSLMWISFNSQHFLMIGSSEGYMRIYDFHKDKIIREERFHDLEIVKIRSQSVFHNTLLPNFQKEIILVIYPNHVITIDPIHLKKELNGDVEEFEYKKWNLQEFAKMNDACCLYSHCSDSSIFEVMEEKSEFDIVAVGKSTLALYSTADEVVEYVRKRTRVKKIATQVASKVFSLASSYGSWLWGGNNNDATTANNNSNSTEEISSEPEEPEILPGTRIPISNRFIDEKREIFHADLDYTGKYLATSDSLGRVLIFDLSTMTVMKVFKGYREAHCYWFFTGSDSENMDSESNIELLLIFAPRRGILECWTIDGRRLYALTIGTDKRFIKASGSFIEGKETQFHHSQFYLISQLDGSIQQVDFNISLEKIQQTQQEQSTNTSDTGNTNSMTSSHVNPFKLLMENKL